MHSVAPKPAHDAVYRELCDLVKKHSADVSAEETLAIAANMVGKLIAMQDQRKLTPEMIITAVMKNIEQGNREAIELLSNTKGNA